MASQASRLGRAALTRSGDVLAQALVDMRGTTSPRLVLELACARILLPGAESDVGAVLARLDRLERRLAVTGAPAATAPEPRSQPEPEPAAVPAPAPAPAAETHVETAPPAPPPPPPAPEPTAPGGLDLPSLRRIWPDLLDAVNVRNKTAHALLRNAEPSAVDAKSVTLSFTTAQLAKMFTDKSEFLREALRDVIGLDVAINAVVGAAPASAPAFPDEEPMPDPEPRAAEVDVRESPPEDPVTLLQRNLGAQVVDQPD
jgi:DNA polymerase-3 subunit gamma/tau